MWINEPRAKRVLAERDLDGLMAATNIPNVFYLSGVWRRQDIAAIVTRDAVTAPWIVIPRGEVDYMVDTVPPAGSGHLRHLPSRHGGQRAAHAPRAAHPRDWASTRSR